MGGEPRVAFQSGRMRFFDAAGCVWTIYDCARIGGRIRKTAYAGALATWRVFVDERGKRHAYRFQRGDTRELDPAQLAQQLIRAQWAKAFQPTRRSRR